LVVEVEDHQEGRTLAPQDECGRQTEFVTTLQLGDPIGRRKRVDGVQHRLANRRKAHAGDANRTEHLLPLGQGGEESRLRQLGYLEADQVSGLSGALAARSRLRWWLIDVIGPVVLRADFARGLRNDLDASGCSLRFAPPDGPEFFRPQGWRPVEVRHLWDEARRLGREPERMSRLWSAASPQVRQPYREIARYVLLERSA
jgi:hypothetical protein